MKLARAIGIPDKKIVLINLTTHHYRGSPIFLIILRNLIVITHNFLLYLEVKYIYRRNHGKAFYFAYANYRKKPQPV